MHPPDPGVRLHIRQGPRHPQHAVIAPRRQPESLGGRGEELAAFGIRRGHLVQQLAIGRWPPPMSQGRGAE